MSKIRDFIHFFVAFSNDLYYNQTCKKNLPFKNFFYITPYLIIYTPLESPGSSPAGAFSLYLFGCESLDNNFRKTAKNSIAGLMICDAALFFIFFFSYSFSYAPANSLFLNIYQISDSTAALSIERPFI